MATALTASTILQQRWGDAWIRGTGADSFWWQLERFQHQFQHQRPSNVLLAEQEPIRFLAAFFAAVQQPCRVWLANPHWGQQEWAQVAAQCQPDCVIGEVPSIIKTSGSVQASENRHRTLADPPTPPLPHSPTPSILIPTGGSSGNIRFAVHTWETLAASVQGFRQHFDCDRVDAYCVLPLHHVSGLMQAMRCLLSGGHLALQAFSDLLTHGAWAGSFQERPPDPDHNQFLSLVPTQLQRLLKVEGEAMSWLRQFHAILLGGAPAWPSLLQTARELGLPLAPTYGMTETAAQVATLLPSEFLDGQGGNGRALPHADLTIHDAGGYELPSGQVGQIAIAAQSLALAIGSQAIAAPLLTGDLGYLDQAGYLHVVGRETSLIITGGEKVLPTEVEAAILATALVTDVAVLGIPDADWGERVIAVVTGMSEADAAMPTDGYQRLQSALRSQLSPYKMPKQWFCCSTLPRNAQGKLNRPALYQWVMAQLSPTAATTASTPALADGVDA